MKKGVLVSTKVISIAAPGVNTLACRVSIRFSELGVPLLVYARSVLIKA